MVPVYTSQESEPGDGLSSSSRKTHLQSVHAPEVCYLKYAKAQVGYPLAPQMNSMQLREKEKQQHPTIYFLSHDPFKDINVFTYRYAHLVLKKKKNQVNSKI